jgi:hypothetical protein
MSPRIQTADTSSTAVLLSCCHTHCRALLQSCTSQLWWAKEKR